MMGDGFQAFGRPVGQAQTPTFPTLPCISCERVAVSQGHRPESQCKDARDFACQMLASTLDAMMGVPPSAPVTPGAYNAYRTVRTATGPTRRGPPSTRSTLRCPSSPIPRYRGCVPLDEKMATFGQRNLSSLECCYAWPNATRLPALSHALAPGVCYSIRVTKIDLSSSPTWEKSPSPADIATLPPVAIARFSANSTAL